ncbi:uncharacterized protein LOC136041205 [Artemia franciscana]|uniref:BZIP domain-containing protein n=1 Tax=Artemia franciscana TaxID=6661 RepID=A0AA88KVV3_ARTSF|nr:hypothetical protein QYM36_017533 [Artemia franciscana]
MMHSHGDISALHNNGMYDYGIGKLRQVNQHYGFIEKQDFTANLGTSEVSHDLQNLMAFNEGFLPVQQFQQNQGHFSTNIVSTQVALTSGGTVTSANMPGPFCHSEAYPFPRITVKREPQEPLLCDESSHLMSTTYPFDRPSPINHTEGSSNSSAFSCKSDCGRSPGDKASEEYRRRRERNNIAVRKSREKAKLRCRETDEKVKMLRRSNEFLQRQCDLLSEEATLLRSLFQNMGGLPDTVQREISLRMETVEHKYRQSSLSLRL